MSIVVGICAAVVVFGYFNLINWLESIAEQLNRIEKKLEEGGSDVTR